MPVWASHKISVKISSPGCAGVSVYGTVRVLLVEFWTSVAPFVVSKGDVAAPVTS